MCGIVGAFAFDTFEKKSQEKIRNEANIFITTELLQTTVERGKDATGVSLIWADGNYTGLKMGIPSPDFIARFGETEEDFQGFLKVWREYPKRMKAFIGHCRKSSIGNSYDNKNNHPIQIGDIIMVHNGTLSNHEKIFDKLGCDRTGDVDSEAIGRLLHHYTKGGAEPFTSEMVKETTKRLAGSYSVIAMSGSNPYQVVQFRDGRPAEMVLVKPLKTVFVASEKKFLENILFAYNKQCKLFSTGVKFPYIKKDDVEFKTLPDDSMCIWDLTTPIDEKTGITDLYDWELTPKKVDKIWDSGTTTTYNNNYNRNKTTNTTNKTTTKTTTTGTTVDATSKGSEKKVDEEKKAESSAEGLVWSKSLNQYKTQVGIDESKKMGSVLIDVNSGKIDEGIDSDKEDTAKTEEIKVEETAVSGLTEVDSDKVENLITAPAEVKESKMSIDDVETKKTTAESDGEDKKQTATTVKVDMTSDPDAIKAAEDFVDKHLTKYEKDEEVIDDLECSDTSVLKDLPLYALANRVKKFVYKQGFIAGYAARKNEHSPVNKGGEKLAKAERKIRALKMLVRIVSACLELRTQGNTNDILNRVIESGIKNTVNEKGRERIKTDGLFSEGDFKKSPLLENVISKLKG